MNNIDSGFDLNLDSEQFSSENLHSIEYWEQELDYVVNSQRELLSTPQQKTDFDVMVSDILEDLRIDNEVLDAELEDVMDEICDSVDNIKVNQVLDKIQSIQEWRERGVVYDMIVDAVIKFPKSRKFILRQVSLASEYHQEILFDLFHKRWFDDVEVQSVFDSILLEDPSFVRSLISLSDFVVLGCEFALDHSDVPYQNKILELLLDEFSDVRQLFRPVDIPLVFEIGDKNDFGDLRRRLFIDLVYQLQSTDDLSPKNLLEFNKIKKIESVNFNKFLENPTVVLNRHGVVSLFKYVELTSDVLTESERVNFYRRLIDTVLMPEYIVDFYDYFISCKQKSFIFTMYSVLREQGQVPSKFANLISRLNSDLRYDALSISKDNFEGGILTDFDALDQNEGWIEKKSWSEDGFNHVQAFSQIGVSLDQVVGDSDELIITYPGSGDHISLIETVARAFSNPNLGIKRSTLKFTELNDKREDIKLKIDSLAQRSDVVSDVSEFIQDPVNSKLSYLSFHVLGLPVKIEYYMKAYDPNSRDDWFGYENLRQSQMLVLHDTDRQFMDVFKLYSPDEHVKVEDYIISFAYNHKSYKSWKSYSRGLSARGDTSKEEFFNIIKRVLTEDKFIQIQSLLDPSKPEFSFNDYLEVRKLLDLNLNKSPISNDIFRLQKIFKFIRKEKMSKVIVMSYAMYDFIIKGGVYKRWGYSKKVLSTDDISHELLDADPGAIFGCDCTGLAHQGMAVVRFSPSSKE